MTACIQCGKLLTYNEIGAHRKFLNRGSKEYFCRNCLARYLDVPPEMIDKKIEQFKEQGCTLFL